MPMTELQIELKPGGRGVLVFGDQDDPLVIEAVEPPTRFSFRWNHPAGERPVATNSMLVEFTLVGEGQRTRLRVVETGHESLAWPQSEQNRYADEHREGWGTFTDRLVRLLAERPRG